MVDKKTAAIAALCVTSVLFLGLWIKSDQYDSMLMEDRIQLLHQIESLETALNTKEAEIYRLQSQVSDMTGLIEGLEGQVTVLENENSRLKEEVSHLEEELGVEEKPLEPLSTFCLVGGFNVWFVDAEWAESLDGYVPKRAGGRFLLMTLIVENTGKSSRLFGVVGEYFGATGSAEVVVIDSERFEYPSFYKVPLHNSRIKWTVLPQMLDPRMTREWIIAFDLPGDANGLQLGLRASKGEDWTKLKLDIWEGP